MSERDALIRIESMTANAMDSAVDGLVRRADLVRIRDEARAALADRPEQPWSVSDEMRKLAERAVEAQRNDKRTEAEIIADGVSFVMGEGFDPPVARPEPAQPLVELDGGYHRGLADGFDEAKRQTAQEPAQPVAHLSAEHLEMAAGLMDDLKPIWLDINKPFFPRAVAADMYAFLNDLMATYAAPPSHPAPSEAGTVVLSYWCPFKDSACGDDPAKRCADCAQPAKDAAS